MQSWGRGRHWAATLNVPLKNTNKLTIYDTVDIWHIKKAAWVDFSEEMVDSNSTCSTKFGWRLVAYGKYAQHLKAFEWKVWILFLTAIYLRGHLTLSHKLGMSDNQHLVRFVVLP